MKHRCSRGALPTVAALLTLSALFAACSDASTGPDGDGSGDSSGGAAAVPSASGGSGLSSGGADTSRNLGGRGATGAESASSGGTPATGGAETTTGGTAAASGGTSPSTGGTPPATGGTAPATGGMSASTGGSQATGASQNSGTVVIGSARSGEATYYNGSGTVNCSYDGITDSMNIAALNQPDYSNAAWCGACARVEGPNGEVTVRIVDLCPGCASGDLDLSPTAFDQIAERSAGRVAISWTFVSCDILGPVTYRYKDGAHAYWTAVLVENHRLPITKMEWSKDGSSWTNMARESYNFFLEASGFGSGNTYVRITATDGQQLVDQLPPVQEYLVTQGAANFD